MMKSLLILFDIALTVALYSVSRALAKRYASPFTTPVFFSTTLVILVLRTLGLRFEDYEPAKNIMVWLLGPATVSLAVPLYKNRHTLVRHAFPACVGLVVGSLSTLVAAAILAKVFALSDNLRASISIKSVTAPIAIELATIIHGNPTLTAVFVIATGMIGAMFGPWLMTMCGIRDPLARGLALGTIAHGQGTAQAVCEGELQGAAAGIAMGLAAVFTSCIAPFLVPLLA
jgi:predicted murein hydrolase (TIGR00659 family)